MAFFTRYIQIIGMSCPWVIAEENACGLSADVDRNLHKMSRSIFYPASLVKTRDASQEKVASGKPVSSSLSRPDLHSILGWQMPCGRSTRELFRPGLDDEDLFFDGLAGERLREIGA